MSGFGKVLSRFSICANLRASAIRPARSAAICAFIHSKSPPAQNTRPRPRNTTTRTASIALTFCANSCRSAIIWPENALRFSGRFNATVNTPRASQERSSVSNLGSSMHQPLCHLSRFFQFYQIKAGFKPLRLHQSCNRLSGNIAFRAGRIGAPA